MKKIDNVSRYLESFYKETNEMIIFLNKRNEIITMNKAATDLLKLHNNLEQVTKSLCNICAGYTNEQSLMTCLNCFVQQELSNKSFQIFIKDENDTPIPFSASYVNLKNCDGIKVLTLQNLSPQIKTQEMLHQKQITQKIIHAQESERKRISRELHDSVVQEILNVVVDLRLTKYKQEDEREKHLQLLEGSLSRLIDDIRLLSVELRPSSLDDLGLEAAFNSHFKQIEKNYGLEVHFDSNLGNNRFNSEIETAVYRITQEAVLNALKYADVDEVDVFIEYNSEEIMVEVTDKGKGFMIGSTPTGTGLGLFGMQERAEIVNGSVEIISQLGTGTSIRLTIPL